jgi:AcrR family transcriptional regulator
MSIRCRMLIKQESVKLSRINWIDCGIRVLAENGVEAVRVEPIAKLLNVTKGSFYWHFKNREELLDAVLQEWVSRETNSIINQVDKVGGDAISKLRYLFELAIRDNGQLEHAIRAWATNDPKTATILAKIDQRRLDYTRDLFLQAGFAPFEALVRARMVYYSLIGEFTVGIHLSQEERLAEIRLQHYILTNKITPG